MSIKIPLAKALARDGLPYDEDNIEGTLLPEEVEVIQYLFPHGRRRRMVAPVGVEYVTKSNGMILEAEINSRVVTMWARMKSDPVEAQISAICQDGPGVIPALKGLIDNLIKLRSIC